MNGKIYKITNTLDQKVYIGRTIQKLVTSRWAVHKSLAKTDEGYLYRAIRKYGLDNFKFEILLDNVQTKEELAFFEKKYISIYDSFNPKFGYNMTSGGENYTLSIEARQKISEANKNRIIKPETRKKHSDFHTGLKASDETKKKMSDTHKNKPNDGWFKKGKIPNETAFKKGRIVPLETIEKMRKTKTGQKRGSYKKKLKT
jgi:group I intron endonuclease